MPPPLRLGLTGGIGSGKSTVAALLSQLGASVIDADAISRAATAAHGAAIPLIQATFGPEVLNAQGALDRDKMRQRIFADHAAKTQLERIVHPIVGQQTQQQVQTAEQSGSSCIVFDIPLLVESQRWRDTLHRILVVDCLPSTQMARVRARNGLSDAEIQPILAAQASRITRLQAADFVLFNDGITLDTLAAQVAEMRPQFAL